LCRKQPKHAHPTLKNEHKRERIFVHGVGFWRRMARAGEACTQQAGPASNINAKARNARSRGETTTDGGGKRRIAIALIIFQSTMPVKLMPVLRCFIRNSHTKHETQKAD
jgi:hypothetical protein